MRCWGKGERRVWHHPRVSTGWRYTGFDFAKLRDNGYFNPDHYHSNEVLLRAWDSRRAFDASWRRLYLLMVISTHPYLLIDDVNLSPFNVGLTIQLKDFTPEQVADLNQRHGSPLQPGQIPALMELVGGHPYLVRQAYYTLVSEGVSLPDLLAVAGSPEGPFGKHLLFYARSLKKSPALRPHFSRFCANRKRRTSRS